MGVQRRLKLAWETLKEIAGQVSEQRFENVRLKYRSDLYLQRQEIKEAFDDFLKSDKSAFLLLGKSGVGKSSFFVSLTDEYNDRDDICFLFYNGAKLDTDKPLNEIIAKDLASHLKLADGEGEREIKDLYQELSRIEGIPNYRVILFVDAVNENKAAHDLLGRIDTLIESLRDPWFKVVISSRPEAWRTMKRGLDLADQRYYRLPGKEELGVELQPFGVEMKPFSREELSLAYDNYRKGYALQTPYASIPLTLKRILNDPLTKIFSRE